MASMETTPYGISTIPEATGPQNSKLADYKDMRKDRKINKKVLNDPTGQNLTTNELINFLGNETGAGAFKDKRASILKMRQAISSDQSNSNVFDRLLTHSTITSRIKEKPPITQSEESQSYMSKGRSSSFNHEIQDIDQSELLWNCDLSIENAHLGPIYSIATLENQLYTCSKKSLKIWDIDTMSCISDITAHNGIIKSL